MLSLRKHWVTKPYFISQSCLIFLGWGLEDVVLEEALGDQTILHITELLDFPIEEAGLEGEGYEQEVNLLAFPFEVLDDLLELVLQVEDALLRLAHVALHHQDVRLVLVEGHPHLLAHPSKTCHNLFVLIISKLSQVK